MFDPMDFVKTEPARAEGATRFVVDLDAMYPAVIAAMLGGEKCSTPDAAHYARKIARAASLKQGCIDAMAECSVSKVRQLQNVLVGATTLEDGSVIGGKPEQRDVLMEVPVAPHETLEHDRLVARAVVLETARLWFTNELCHKAGGKIEVRLPNVKRWKLGVDVQV